jgi:hypothetical protein
LASTDSEHLNPRRQIVHRRIGPSPTLRGKYTYELECLNCGFHYGANRATGCEIDPRPARQPRVVSYLLRSDLFRKAKARHAGAPALRLHRSSRDVSDILLAQILDRLSGQDQFLLKCFLHNSLSFSKGLWQRGQRPPRPSQPPQVHLPHRSDDSVQ